MDINTDVIFCIKYLKSFNAQEKPPIPGPFDKKKKGIHNGRDPS